MPRVRVIWQIAGDITARYLRTVGVDPEGEMSRTEATYHEWCWREIEARIADMEA